MNSADELIKMALADRAATVTEDSLRYSDLRLASDARGRRIGRAAKDGARFWWMVSAAAVATVAVATAAFALGDETHHATGAGGGPPSVPAQSNTLRAPNAYCQQTPTSRSGTATTMVPEQPTSVTICTHVPQRPAKTITNISGLVRALDALPTTPISNGCQARSPSAPPAAGTYELHFHYPSGPDVLVNVLPRCRPSINNLQLQAESSTTLVPLIEQALTKG
jgi:hypothetical protein